MTNADPSGAPASPVAEERETAPAAHWRRRNAKRVPLPSDQAARQGAITRLALLSLGKDGAIAFLNAEDETLGGRPLDIATASADGERMVRHRLELAASPANGSGSDQPE